MALDLSGVQDLTDKQKAAIIEAHDADTAGLKKSRDDILGESKAAKAKAEAAAKEKEKAEVAAADKAITDAKDLESVRTALAAKESLVASLEEKAKTREKEFTLEREAGILTQSVQDLVTQNVNVKDPAAKMFMTAKFKEGLEIRDGKTQPKDAAQTLDTYTKAIVDDKAHASYIVGGNGSGGGASGNQSNSRAGAKSITREQFDTLNPLAKSEHFKSGGVITD